MSLEFILHILYEAYYMLFMKPCIWSAHVAWGHVLFIAYDYYWLGYYMVQQKKAPSAFGIQACAALITNISTDVGSSSKNGRG